MKLKKIGHLEYECTTYDWGKCKDYVCGHVKFGGPERYWYFYSTSLRPLSSRELRRLSEIVSKLNVILKNNDAKETEEFTFDKEIWIL